MNTMPVALISTNKKQTFNEEAEQRIERFGTKLKNKNVSNRPCRYCSATNRTPTHKYPALQANCNKCGRKRTLRKDV